MFLLFLLFFFGETVITVGLLCVCVCVCVFRLREDDARVLPYDASWSVCALRRPSPLLSRLFVLLLPRPGGEGTRGARI